ncbi:hypothetical protein CAP50_01620 [Psychrobacter sp. L7]|nr:hypothetical protein CAP50_01620 [Psychrobacter sp. L7]
MCQFYVELVAFHHEHEGLGDSGRGVYSDINDIKTKVFSIFLSVFLYNHVMADTKVCGMTSSSLAVFWSIYPSYYLSAIYEQPSII